MAESTQVQSKCYICDQYVTASGPNIFTSTTENTKTIISDLLEQFSGHRLTRASNKSFCCSKCLSRINDYDLACFTAHQVQKELTDLLSTTEEKYANSALATVVEENENFEGVEGDAFDDVIEEDHDEVEEDHDKVEESPLIIVKGEQRSGVGFDDVKYEPLDIETDEYELHFYTIQNVEKDEPVCDSGDDDDNNDDEIVYDVYPDQMDMIVQKSKSGSYDPSLPRPSPNYCLQCERNFETKELLSEHRRTIHKKPPKTHPCGTCGAVFKLRNALRVHMLTHTGESPFNCDICGKKFTQKGALKRHMPIHTGECRFQCDKCGKQFIHYSSFHMHNMAHDDIRKKKCEICGLMLRSNSHLKRHLQVHTGAKPHKCPKCDKTFAQRYNMMTHLRSHQGLPRKRKHTCPVCERTFTKEVSLQEHIATGVCQAADPMNADMVELCQQLATPVMD